MNYTRAAGDSRSYRSNLQPICHHVDELHVEQRLEFLASFLDDRELRDVKDSPEKYQGPHAASGFDRITVRDYAAKKIAWMLKLDDRPETDWTEDDWQQLRERVAAALADYRLSRP